MSGWQRRTRFFIGVFAVLFATVVLFTIRERSEPGPVAFERIDLQAVVERIQQAIEKIEHAPRRCVFGGDRKG